MGSGRKGTTVKYIYCRWGKVVYEHKDWKKASDVSRKRIFFYLFCSGEFNKLKVIGLYKLKKLSIGYGCQAGSIDGP